MDLQEVKLYLKIDHDEDDLLLDELIVAAEIYLENAGCKKDTQNRLYILATKLLISHWYENRGVTGDFGYLEFGLKSIITQLRDVKIKDAEEVENEE